jgi:hypothetical protein
MTRKSAASFAVPAPIRHEVARLAVPPHLGPDAADVWQSIVRALPADYFRAEISPMLERFCVTLARVRQVETLILGCDPATDIERFALLAKLARAESAHAAALARSLRITNQARLNATTAAHRAATARPQPGIAALFGRAYGEAK